MGGFLVLGAAQQISKEKDNVMRNFFTNNKITKTDSKMTTDGHINRLGLPHLLNNVKSYSIILI